MMELRPGDAVLYMKVGTHAQENSRIFLYVRIKR